MSNRVDHQTLIQTTAELSFGWFFRVQLGLRQTQAPIKTKTIRRRRVPPATLLLSCNLLLISNVAGGTLLLLIVLVLISACVCRRPSWTPKTQPNDSSAVVWLSFWCSTRLLMSVKKCLSYRRKMCNDSQLPKAELNTRNSTKRRRKGSFGWVSGVQLTLAWLDLLSLCFVWLSFLLFNSL